MFLVMAVLAAASVSSVCLASTIPTTGLEAWLKADSITGVANGGSVATWTNSAGTGTTYNATASGTAMPTYYTSGINGRPVLSFDGSDDGMVMGATPMHNQSVFTIFAVIERATDPGTNAVIVGNIESTGGVRGMVFGTAGSVDSGINFNTSSVFYANGRNTANNSVRTTPVGSLTANTPHVISTSWVTGTGLTVYIDGVGPQALRSWVDGVTTNQVWMPTDPGLGIGTGLLISASWGIFKGDIAELIFYNGTLSSADYSAVDTYLYNKYVVPEPGTLALLATGLIGLLCYAWKKRR